MNAARKKKQSTALPAGLVKLGAILFGPGRGVVIAAVFIAAFAVGWYFLWQKVRDPVLSSDSYLVTADKVELTPPPPEWIHTDIRAEVFRSASLQEPMSLMDDDLPERVYNAFALHPWIAKVRKVTKQHPARVRVEAEYRRPVCVVELPDGLFPVDAGGVLLPAEDISLVQAGRYPRLLNIDTAPVGIVGQSWGDARVLGGAEIADALRDTWDTWNLLHIVPAPTGIRDEYSYALVARGGTRVRWGLPPGSKAQGELSTDDKIARLHRYIEKHGTLEGRDGPQELDISEME